MPNRWASVTRGEYPENWKEIAWRVKEAASWKCIRCGHPHNVDTKHVLTVHHLDGQKNNCRWWNLLALCQRCHLSIQARVSMDQFYFGEHTEWFRPYVAGWAAEMLEGMRIERHHLEWEPVMEWLLARARGEKAVCLSLGPDI